jgi:glycosyltransferase involved in cell wall biosynthesis
MRVLLYSHLFMPVPGGTQTIVFELATGLAEWQSNHPDCGSTEVTVVTRTRESSPQDDSLPFRLVRCPGVWTLIRLLRASDVIHLAGPAMLPLALSLMLRKPVIVEHHGFQVACPNGLLFYEPEQALCPGHFMAGNYGKCLKCNRVKVGSTKSFSMLVLTGLRRCLSATADMNIMPTEWLGKVLKLKRMKTVHHGMLGSSGSSFANPSPATFAYHGRLVSTKGVSLLIQAADLLQKQGWEFRLKIIGDGPELTRLKSSAAQLSSKIEFLGHVPAAELDEALCDASTIIMPSLSGEVFGLVASENMLRGKLLIVSDLGSLQEVVGDTGLVFRNGDAQDLASCMQRVLERPALSSSLGSAARARAQTVFGRDAMIQDHLRVYQGALRR